MTPEALAALHALCFTDAPRPWQAQAFETLRAAPGVFLAVQGQGFVMGRVAGPECEVLTLAVHPDHRRAGLGQSLMARFAAEARAGGAVEGFLDVAEDNLPARALYARDGWQEVGRRKGYYRARAVAPVDALVLKRAL